MASKTAKKMEVVTEIPNEFHWLFDGRGFREELLFPDYFELRVPDKGEPLVAAISLQTLSDIGCRRSEQAEKAEYICVRSAYRVSTYATAPGLWLAPGQLPALAEACKRIADLRDSRAEAQRQREQEKRESARQREQKKNDRLFAKKQKRLLHVTAVLNKDGLSTAHPWAASLVEKIAEQVVLAGKERTPKEEIISKAVQGLWLILASSLGKVSTDFVRMEQEIELFGQRVSVGCNARLPEVLMVNHVGSVGHIGSDDSSVKPPESFAAQRDLWLLTERAWLQEQEATGDDAKEPGRPLNGLRLLLSQRNESLAENIRQFVLSQAAPQFARELRSLQEKAGVISEVISTVRGFNMIFEAPALQNKMELSDVKDSLGQSISKHFFDHITKAFGWRLFKNSTVECSRPFEISLKNKEGHQEIYLEKTALVRYTLNKLVEAEPRHSHALSDAGSGTNSPLVRMTLGLLALGPSSSEKMNTKISTVITHQQKYLSSLIAPVVGRIEDAEIKAKINAAVGTIIFENNQVQAGFSQQGKLAEWVQETKTRLNVQEACRELKNYVAGFPAARAASRRITFFSGPTNSGKTHRAMDLLATAKSGVYLGPLRLLALEGQQRLRERGVSCSLVTGEEQDIVEGASHVAQTIETLNFELSYEVAVIDEIQFINDAQRGWAWTQALCGVNAAHLVLTGSPDALVLVRQIAASLGESLEVVELTRLTPLTYQEKSVGFKHVPPRSAIICFSRKGVLGIRDHMKSLGRSVACLYGGLSPQSRRMEAERFACGQADVLVATDVIGYGLNLPIDYVLFAELEKFDGVTYRNLNTSELRQIGGRAGRYGLTDLSTGVVGRIDQTTDYYESKRMAAAFKPEALHQAAGLTIAYVLPSYSHFQTIARRLGISFEQALETANSYFSYEEKWSRVPKEALNALIAKVDMVAKIERKLNKKVSDHTRWLMATAPADDKDEETYLNFVRIVVQGEQLRQPKIKNWTISRETLEKAEIAIKRLTLYRWFSFKWPENFPDGALVDAERESLSIEIAKYLASSALSHGCDSCGRKLPPLWRHKKCDNCWRADREYY